MNETTNAASVAPVSHSFAVGSEVVRIKGEQYQIGATGTVVEVQGDRLRVRWLRNPALGLNQPQKTWVSYRVVNAA